MDDIIIQKSSTENLAHYLNQEWLETNQLGGYASSSILNCHTRKYHGLLTVEIPTHTEKQLLLSQLEEEITLDHQTYPLSFFGYRNCYFHGRGFDYFTEFKQSIFPEFIYQCDSHRITRKLMMLNHQNTVLVRYDIERTGADLIHPEINANGNKNSEALFQMKIRPLFAMRNFHGVQKASSNLFSEFVAAPQGIILKFEHFPDICLQVNASFEFVWQPLWYFQFEYFNELERGYDGIEDLYSPGFFTISATAEQPILFSASLSPGSSEFENPGFKSAESDLLRFWQLEQSRRQQLTEKLTGDSLAQRLSFTARSFLREVNSDKLNFIENQSQVNPQNNASVVAGYHWFMDWGRDAMIALPGLTLMNPGQAYECLAVLRYFASFMKDGLIPNFIGSGPQSHSFCTADASLWYVWAAQQFWHTTRDLLVVKNELWPALCQIFTHYSRGTHYNIRLHESGLIWSGHSKANISWMDAVIDGIPVTPRYGFKVEINALWYNFLGFIHELLIEFDKSPMTANLSIANPNFTEIDNQLIKTKNAFLETFCYTERNYLYDFVNDQESNKDIRPNQIFAISLPYSPLNLLQSKQILNLVEKYLYTPYGLRALSPQHENYQGEYSGNQFKRDRAYHQGTVWPWLLGHYTAALLRVYSKEYVNVILSKSKEAFTQHLNEHGIGSIAEIFDGDYPFQPRGCISQAWSVAEVLRMLKLLG